MPDTFAAELCNFEMEKTLTFETPRQLSELYKDSQKNLDMAESCFGVRIVTREAWISVSGDNPDKVDQAAEFFKVLSEARAQGLKLGQSDYESIMKKAASGKIGEVRALFKNPIVYSFKRKSVVPKNINQKRYLQNIDANDIVIGIGPAGTGKTYLAVAAALKAMADKRVERIILTRPAVEAGEALGFLPGDLQEKLLPYLRPLYDALYDMLGAEETAKLMEKRAVEIAPLAYMRGRTLSNAFIILDEAQNTTMEQMMMFLTRLGENSRMVVTGDITQVDLPRNKRSGLKGAAEVLEGIDGISIFRFDKNDVVRHPLVSKIIQAYAAYNGEEI